MGIRRKIRRFRKVYKQIILIFLVSFIFSQAEYQITSIPHNSKQLALHNGLNALYGIDNINNNSASLLHYPSQIKLLSYNSQKFNFSFLDYGILENKIDNQIINSFSAYECLIQYSLQKTINDLFKINLLSGFLISKIGTYSSNALITNININTKIENTYLLLSLNNLGIVLDNYTNHSIKLPSFSQFSIVKAFNNDLVYFGYDHIYNFNTDKNEHIISLRSEINNNLLLRLSGSSYRKEMLVDDFNNDFYYGMAVGLTIKTNKKSTFDIGICSLGTAGYLYGITINY